MPKGVSEAGPCDDKAERLDLYSTTRRRRDENRFWPAEISQHKGIRPRIYDGGSISIKSQNKVVM